MNANHEVKQPWGPHEPTLVVSVLISTRNNESTIEECLTSVVRQVRQPQEIVVVNDGSSDATLEKVCAFARAHLHPPIRVISLERSLGIAGARNIAMKRASGRVFAFLDADAFAEPAWLSELLSGFAPGVACVGGPDRVPEDDPLVSRCAGYSMHSVIGSGGLRKGATRLSRYLAAGCNMAVTREAIDRVGGFDETMVPRGEEKDLQLRFSGAGYRTAYAAGATVWHRRRSSIQAFWRQMIESGVVRVKIFRRNPGRAQAAQFAPAAVLAAAIIGGAAGLAIVPVRILWLVLVAAYASLLLLDGVLAAVALRDLRAALVAPVTSAAVLIGYGTGTLLEIARPSEHRRVIHPRVEVS